MSTVCKLGISNDNYKDNKEKTYLLIDILRIVIFQITNFRL